MKFEEAKEIVEAAAISRKQWGKHSSNADLPVEFLDALIVYVDGVDAGRMAAVEAVSNRQAQAKANRQAGAARARAARAAK
jgi:hypothetical protein